MAEEKKKADVTKLLKEIKDSITTKDDKGNLKIHRTSSQRDEIRVMREMLNDRDYKVGVYTSNGKEGEICPSDEARNLIASVISSAAKINKEESKKLADNHEFDKKESSNFINVSKEFVNTYLQSGRKLPLGGRENTNTSLLVNKTDPKTEPKNVRIGHDDNGKPMNAIRDIYTPSFEKVKAISTCPDWVKAREKEKK